MIDAKCLVCRNADRRRLIEAGWNAGMQGETIARVIDEKGIVASTILRHIKEHASGDGNIRAIEIEPEKPVRQRILDLQRLQLDEIERRIGLAKTRADLMNAEHEGEDDWTPVDWSYFHDVLSKDAQAAINTILKTQGLTDKRELKEKDLKLGLFEAMVGAGLAPKALVGRTDVPELGPGDDDDAD